MLGNISRFMLESDSVTLGIFILNVRACRDLNNDGSLLVHGDHSIVVSSAENPQGGAVAPLQQRHAIAETHTSQAATSRRHKPRTNCQRAGGGGGVDFLLLPR